MIVFSERRCSAMAPGARASSKCSINAASKQKCFRYKKAALFLVIRLKVFKKDKQIKEEMP